MKSKNAFPALFILPALFLAVLVWGVPLIYALILSFTNAGPGRLGEFVGFTNYINALLDRRFLNSIVVSVILSAGAVFLNVGVALFLSLALRNAQRARAVSLSVLLVPWILSELAVALIWNALCHENYGLFNTALMGMGFPAVPWITNVFFAYLVLWGALVWRGLAFSTMLQMAGLASLPEKLIHAAKTQGASSWMIFREIVIPHQKNILVTNALLVFLMTFVSFSLPFALTKGGPIHATQTTALYVYNLAFGGDFQLGYASAVGMLVLLIYATFSMFYLKLRKGEA